MAGRRSFRPIYLEWDWLEGSEEGAERDETGQRHTLSTSHCSGEDGGDEIMGEMR